MQFLLTIITYQIDIFAKLHKITHSKNEHDVIPQPVITFSKSKIETLKQGVKCVQS